MRIIGGRLGGRRFYPPAKGWPTRPTTDIAKEALYNILQGRLDFEETVFLDLFGGTGSHSFEMISRGCTNVTYVDNFKPCCLFVRKTAEELGIAAYITVIQMDAFKFCKTGKQFDYIFAGPPYPLKSLDTIPDVILENRMLKPDGFLVLEHNPNHSFTGHPAFKEVRVYGETHFTFFVDRKSSQSPCLSADRKVTVLPKGDEPLADKVKVKSLSCELRTEHYSLRTVPPQVRHPLSHSKPCRLPPASCGLPTESCQLSIEDCILPTED